MRAPAFANGEYYLTDNFFERIIKFIQAVYRLFIYINIRKQKFISSQDTIIINLKNLKICGP